MEIIMEVNENTSEPTDEIRKVLYPTLVVMAQDLRYPAKQLKLVAWDDFDGDREFYFGKGFSHYQSYHIAQRSLEKPIPMSI
jgi:hypothetical protein